MQIPRLDWVMPAPVTDYYKLLGISPSATGEEITRAYRKAMKQAHPDSQHPDRRSGAEERAKELNLAYATLSRPDQRRQYDAQLRAALMQEQIMGRYTGGFTGAQTGSGSPFAPPPPRRSEFLIREQKRADRGATISLFLTFGCLGVLIIGGLMLLTLIMLLYRFML